MKKILVLITAFLGVLTSSCDKDFEQVNISPNDPTEIPAHLLLGNILRVNQNVIYGMQQGGDMGMCWAQHVSKVQYNDEERYIPRRGSIDGVWDALYASVISDARTMGKIADKEGNANLKAVSLVLQANAFQILTDLYGPIPFTQFGQEGILKPTYDSQEVVYDGILKMLSDAESIFASGTGVIPAGSDLIYAGNSAKWRKLANSLKFKALMRISKKRNVSSELQALVDSGQLMSSNADSAQLLYKSAQPDANPIYETIVFGTRKEYKLSSTLVDKLLDYQDGRIEVIAALNKDSEYVGNKPGERNDSNYDGFSSFGEFYLNPELPGVILSNAQVQFYLAEAANEGYISGGIEKAKEYYKNGIVSSFLFNKLTTQAAETYALSGKVLFDTKEVAREKIAEQMWISLFGQGFEAWTEWRRTGFPALEQVIGAWENMETPPSRLYYHSNEPALNRANYEAAVKLLTGGDKLTSAVWWMN